MSAKDAPGEVNTNEVFDSPNISSEEDIASEESKAVEEQKKRETVDIDGVPIDEKDIEYKAEDIRKKKKINYFVDVEGAEERAKEEAKKKEIAKREAEKIAEAEKQDAERKEKAEKDAAEKKKLEEKKQIEEVNAYIKRQKADKAKKERNEKIANNLSANKKKITIASIAALAVIALCVVVGIVFNINNDGGEIESEEEQKKVMEEYVKKTENDKYFTATYDLDTSEDLERALKNHDYETVDFIFQSYIDETNDNIEKGKLYANKAKRILKSNNRAKDQVMAAIMKAYELAPEEVSVLQPLHDIYVFYDDLDNADKIQKKLDDAYQETYSNSNSNSIEIEG